MGRHRTAQEKVELGEAARRLRAQGRSRPQIVEELGVASRLLTQLLEGTEVPDRLRRPRAKDDVREAARELRRQGRTYPEIALELGVSKSSCSLWLRDLPHPAEVDLVRVSATAPAATAESQSQHVIRAEAAVRRDTARALREEGALLKEIAEVLGVSVKTVHQYCADLPVPPRGQLRGGDREHMQMMRRRYWDAVLAEREAERSQVKAVAAARVGGLSPRELSLLATTAYWAEGSKSKPYARREQVTFINSDPHMILLWLTYLDHIDFPREHRRFRVSIHESADVEAAEAWWAALIGVPVEVFRPATLKRHNPKTVRKNVQEDYRGCLVVRLVQCRQLYQEIEGTWQGIIAGAASQAS